MRKVQYVSQKSVKEDDVYRLTEAEQDRFIKEVGLAMGAEMRVRTGDAFPLGDIAYQVTGPHSDPIQGLIHIHTMAAWYDLDQMPADAPFRLEFLATLTEANSGQDQIR